MDRVSASSDHAPPSQLTRIGPEPSSPELVGAAAPTLLPVQAASEGQAMMVDGGLPASMPSIALAARMPPPPSAFSATASAPAAQPAPLLGPGPSRPSSAEPTSRADPSEPSSLSIGKMPFGAPAGLSAGESSARAGPSPGITSDSSGGRTSFLEFPTEATPVGGSRNVASGLDQSQAGGPSSQTRSSVEYRVLSVPVEGVALVQTDPQKSVRPIRVGERLPDGSVLKRADVATGKVETSR